MNDATNKPIRVMIVDDSAIIRNILQQALKKEPDIEVVNSAFNGKMALDLLTDTPVDVILLDIEMPEMDGLTALPELLKIAPRTSIIMISTLTHRNAAISFKALMLGACDYLPKPSSSKDAEKIQQFYRDLIAKIRVLASSGMIVNSYHIAHTPKPVPASVKSHSQGTYVQAIAIGCSTGGTQALDVVFKGLAGKFPNVPLFITLHMPPTFTTVLAQHIAEISGRPCAEAKDGEWVIPGSIYLAPGDFHMVPEMADGKVRIRLNQNAPVNFCRPSVDPMLEALSQIYGRHLFVAILTGMGSDGLAGVRKVVAAKGTVIAQDEATSVVWGMPRVVVEQKLCSAVLPITEIAPYILKSFPEKFL